MRRSRSALFACALAVSGGELRAETPATDLQSAERAYREVDFERTHRLALQALEQGGHGIATTARLHLLLGLSSAALERREDAYQAFVRLLAIAPQLKLDAELSPKMRGAYLEARGFWNSVRAPLEIRVAGTHADELAFELSDPIRVVERVRVVLRGQPGRTVELPAAKPRVTLTQKERAQSFAYEVTLLDAHGNAMHALLGRRRALPAHVQPERAALYDQRGHSLHYLAAGLFGTLGLAATVAGAVFHAQRERRASEWNGETCEKPGATRGEQCAEVDAARLDAERWAVGAYATGGALLVGGVVTVLSAPRGTESNRTRTVGAPACVPWKLGVSCKLRF